MDMKIDGKRIKALRLKLSWSQEKLAEKAGLNPRTVQRAESEGSASLRTRLLLAQALQILPEHLDAPDNKTEGRLTEPQGLPLVSSPNPLATNNPFARLQARLRSNGIYYLIVLALVSVIYAASKPTYFSLSLANYDYTNRIIRGNQLHEIAAWWVMTLSIWMWLSVPILAHLYKKYRVLFLPYLVGFCLGLGLALLRSWQITMVAEFLTAVLYMGGLCLLLSLYIPRLDTSMMRHGVYMCLSAYVFIWFFQSIGLVGMLAYISIGQDGTPFPNGAILEYGNPSSPLPYLFNVLLINFGKLLQLIPLTLVLLLSLGEKDGDGENSLPITVWKSFLGRIQRKKSVQDTRPSDPERPEQSRSSSIVPLTPSMQSTTL